MTTDEVEKQRDERQQAESDHETRTAVPVEEQLQSRNQQPVSRGLSRLFSSLLKRRSQCESNAGDNKDEEETKAPIADPEPELRAEGEVAHDQHSVSSADAQVSLCLCLHKVTQSQCDYKNFFTHFSGDVDEERFQRSHHQDCSVQPLSS